MPTNTFFEEVAPQSAVKAAIVSKYFGAWARVMLGSRKADKRLLYLDLFAGPGRYGQGTRSTPLMVLEHALQHPELRETLVTIFNDKSTVFAQSLQKEIDQLDGIHSLNYPPVIWNREVGEDIARELEEYDLVPTLFFVDPWGYKGLSLRLVNAVLKNWGSDCIFFFNYNRINTGISNEAITQHLDALFGSEIIDLMREEFAASNPSPEERECIILELLATALKESARIACGVTPRYVLPFRFRNPSDTRTSHYLIFVSKHSLGYEIMKEIMWKESSERVGGVGSFEYVQAPEQQTLLYSLSRPLDELGGRLLRKYPGKTITMGDIFKDDNVDTPYVKSNYRDALLELESAGFIETNPPAIRRQMKQGKRTFGPKVEVSFPSVPPVNAPIGRTHKGHISGATRPPKPLSEDEWSPTYGND